MPKETAEWHINPWGLGKPDVRIFGHQLLPGDTIESTDVYNSTGGTWEVAPCPGCTLSEGVSVIWVRPCAPIEVEQPTTPTDQT